MMLTSFIMSPLETSLFNTVVIVIIRYAFLMFSFDYCFVTVNFYILRYSLL